jgi:hypothetical protein
MCRCDMDRTLPPPVPWTSGKKSSVILEIVRRDRRPCHDKSSKKDDEAESKTMSV